MFQDDLKEHLNDVKEEFEKYVENRFDLIKLHIVEELSRFASGFALRTGILYLLLFGLLFISMALAFFLSDLFESRTLGFSLVALIYFVFALLFYLLRKKLIEKPIIRSFFKLFFPKFDDDEE